MKLQSCVYILLSHKDHLLYIGQTDDLKRRLTEHFHGHSQSTAPRRPFSLVFCEYFIFREDALHRERYFKTTAGKKALKLMLKTTFSKLGYKNTLSSK